REEALADLLGDQGELRSRERADHGQALQEEHALDGAGDPLLVAEEPALIEHIRASPARCASGPARAPPLAAGRGQPRAPRAPPPAAAAGRTARARRRGTRPGSARS